MAVTKSVSELAHLVEFALAVIHVMDGLSERPDMEVRISRDLIYLYVNGEETWCFGAHGQVPNHRDWENLLRKMVSL